MEGQINTMFFSHDIHCSLLAGSHVHVSFREYGKFWSPLRELTWARLYGGMLGFLFCRIFALESSFPLWNSRAVTWIRKCLQRQPPLTSGWVVNGWNFSLRWTIPLNPGEWRFTRKLNVETGSVTCLRGRVLASGGTFPPYSRADRCTDIPPPPSRCRWHCRRRASTSTGEYLSGGKRREKKKTKKKSCF